MASSMTLQADDAPRDLDWAAIETELNRNGAALLRGLLSAAQCEALAALYDQDQGFRTRVIMARHGFGRGEYRYFTYPLPPLVQSLREGLYSGLSPIANRWHERMGLTARFPAGQEAFLGRCHEAGQTKPTPLLLSYGPGDFNCLHQDLYGENVFPLQVVVLLSEPGRDFEGGELVLTEQRPRVQSRAMVLPLTQGDAAVFAVNWRPVRGARDDYRVALRHGVSELRSGRRHALGLIFHDAI